MEKKLYELFNEATPSELDQFTEELQTPELEHTVLSSIKNKVYAKTKLDHYYNEKGRIITMKKEKNFTRICKSIIASVACLVLMFVCLAGYNAFFKQPPTTESKIIATIVTLDVNPSLEIKANEDENVLEVVALNKDAEVIIGDMNFEGESLELTVNTLIDSMIGNGYISETTNAVLLSIDNKDENIGNAIKDKLSAEISDLINTESIQGSVISQIVSGDDEELSGLASEYGISIGKAKLIQTIMKMNSDGEFSDYAELSITELNAVMNTKAEETKDNNAYIGKEKALEIALNKLNLTLNDLDAEPKIELVASRGDICYHVELHRSRNDENGAHSASYTIYIDAFTGKLHGEGVTEPNFSMEEAWGFVCDQLGSDAEKANLLDQIFNDMESGLPMTYSFFYEIGDNEYCALVDAMNGTVIRIDNM